MRRIAFATTIASATLFFSLGGMAQAHPVSLQRATRAIRSDAWDFGSSNTPTVEACTADHYGTLCVVTSSTCFDDTFGAAVDTDTERVWVSRTRGRIAVVILPGTQTTIWAAPVGCGVGEQPSPS